MHIIFLLYILYINNIMHIIAYYALIECMPYTVAWTQESHH